MSIAGYSVRTAGVLLGYFMSSAEYCMSTAVILLGYCVRAARALLEYNGGNA